MKCKGKLICKAGAQWLGVLAHFSVIHTGPDIKSVSTWLNSFPEVVLAQGKAAVEAGLCCPTTHITELTLVIAFLPQLCAAARVFSHQDCRSGRRQTLPSQPYMQLSHSQEQDSSRARPASHPPQLHSPAFAAGAPDQVVPQCNNTPQGSSVHTTAPWDPGLGKAQEKSETAPAVLLVLQQQELPGALHWLR